MGATMRIAAIQHRLRGDADADARALAAAASSAASRGASIIVCPHVASLRSEAGAGAVLLAELLADVPALCLVPDVDPASTGVAMAVDLPAVEEAPGGLGMAALVVGDACIDPKELGGLFVQHPRLAVLSPRSQTDLQAEAILEYAIALSDSLAGVVVIAECSGAEPLEAGHGGSAIVVLGDVLAEALSPDDVLIAEVAVPFPEPEPREPLPSVPPLLAQRLELHHGVLPSGHGPDLS
jgi:predicted amidohydrolase